jgi:hypothetical protein
MLFGSGSIQLFFLKINATYAKGNGTVIGTWSAYKCKMKKEHGCGS